MAHVNEVLTVDECQKADSDQAYFWAKEWRRMEQEIDESIARGEVYQLGSPDDLDRLAEEIDHFRQHAPPHATN